MTRGRARRYLLTKQGYYPGVVASMGYDVWDWSTLNAGTLFQDSAKTTPVASNSDPVGAWVDGVSGVDAVQATTANKPTYSTNTLNGLPTLSFDGGDKLTATSLTYGTFAIWIVYKQSVASRAYTYQHILDANNQDILQTAYAPASLTVNRGGVTSAYSFTIPGDDTYRIVRYGFNGTHATHTLALNNVIQSITSSSASDPGTSSVDGQFIIGANTGAIYTTGNIGQLLIVSPYPTDASILTNMQSYINNQWNGVY